VIDHESRFAQTTGDELADRGVVFDEQRAHENMISDPKGWRR
jgi:hypothetical protein